MKFDGTIRVVSSIKPPLYTILCIFLPFSSSEYISPFMQQNMQQMYASFIDPSDLSNFSKLLFLKKKELPTFLSPDHFQAKNFTWHLQEKKKKGKIYIDVTAPSLWTKLGQPSCGCIANIKDPQDAEKFRDEPVGNLKLSVPSFPIRRSSPSRSIVPPRKTITVHEKGGFKACDDIPYAGLVVIIQA